MKNIKMIITVFLISTIALVSCKKDSTTGPEGSGALVGTWQIVNAIVGYYLTTNSNQVAANIFDVTGQISVTGAVNSTLDFMYVDEDTNPPSFFIGSQDENNPFTLAIDGPTGDGMFINLTTYQIFMGTVTYSFNNGSLTITQSTLQDQASTDVVNISGTLSYSMTNIPANTPTFVPFITDNTGEEDFGFSTIEFRNDGTATVTDVDEYGTDTENWTYVTDGNQITITDEFNDTMVWEYSVSGNNMTWNSTDLITVCDVDETEAECYAAYEDFFVLAEGSLTNVSGKAELMFSKAVAKQRKNIVRIDKIINPTKMMTEYKLKLENLKLAK